LRSGAKLPDTFRGADPADTHAFGHDNIFHFLGFGCWLSFIFKNYFNFLQIGLRPKALQMEGGFFSYNLFCFFEHFIMFDRAIYPLKYFLMIFQEILQFCDVVFTAAATKITKVAVAPAKLAPILAAIMPLRTTMFHNNTFDADFFIYFSFVRSTIFTIHLGLVG
jgi:hypothetical protein